MSAGAIRPVAITAFLALGVADLVFINTAVLPRLVGGGGVPTHLARVDVEMAAPPSTTATPPPESPAAATLAPAAATAPAAPAAPAAAAPVVAAAAPGAVEGTGFKVAPREEAEPAAQPVAVGELGRTTALFRTGDARLDPQARAEVDRIIPIATRDPRAVILIEGHADARGDSGLNERLSRRRAQAVARRLTVAGVAGRRLVIKAHGARRPLDGRSDADSLRRNRRVEIVVSGGGGPS